MLIVLTEKSMKRYDFAAFYEYIWLLSFFFCPINIIICLSEVYSLYTTKKVCERLLFLSFVNVTEIIGYLKLFMDFQDSFKKNKPLWCCWSVGHVFLKLLPNLELIMCDIIWFSKYILQKRDNP